MSGVQSAQVNKQTSPLREWLALFTSTAWYFSTYQSYDPVLHSSDMNMFWFSVVFALPIILLSLIFSNNIKTVSQIARYTTPFGIAITILMPLLPDSWFVALFILSGPFIAPLAIRCCYGVVQSAKPNKRLQTFMSAITSAIFIYAAWLLVVQTLKLTSFMHFLFPAVMALISYMLTYRNPPEYIVPAHIVSLSLTKHIFYVIFVFLIVFVFDLTSDLFHTYFLSEGLSNDLLLFVGGVFLPAASLTLYAVLADRRHEKKAILVGMSLYLLGLILALARKDTAVWPLTIADGIGGAYADFFVVGFSILFFAETKRPVLMSSLGLAIDILTASFLWTADIWLPVSFLHGSFGISHLVSMAVLTILLLVTAMLAFDRQNEKNIVSALFRRLSSESALSESDAQLTAEPTDEILLQAGFEPLEREISLLLIEGYTHSEISRRLHLPASKMRILLKQIRNKVSGVTIPNTETVLEQVTADYALTKRETQILKTLSEGKTNPEIAAELFISTETVKFHIRNLKKKIPVTERGQISSWLSTYRSQ